MSRWAIYDKDGNVLHESIEEFDGKGKIVYQDTFEYVGKWMGECHLTISIKSPYPIDFQIGDYIEYRGEKFTINYDPTVIKKARRGTYGEGFVYDSIKFNSYSNELTMMLFHDWVLNDNKVHYTSLPAFSFYAKDVDDLVDRLQACADRWCRDNGRDKSEYWMFYTLANNTQGTKDTGQYQTTYERTVQRAKDISTDSAFVSAVQSEWTKTYGNPSDYKDSRDDERYDRNISISNNTVWDGLQKVKTEFGLNFIIRGRNVYVGTVGVPTSHLFEYGKGKGLYEVDKTADTDQKVVTRLHAYGSDQNMPTRYYAEVTSEAFSTIKEIKENPPDYSFARFILDLPYSSRYFTNAMTKYGSNIYAVGIKVGDILVNARVEGTDNNGNVEIYSECLQSSTDDDDNTDFANFGQFKSAIAVGAKIFFTKGVDRSAFPISNIGFEDGVKALPDNMAVNSLMLPGFPLYSLADICKSVYDSASNSTNYYIKKKPSGTDDEYVLFHTESGKHVVSFSDDRHDPYIVSQNAASLGYRDGDISCTESNDDNGLEAVYPSIEKVTVSDAGIGSGDARVDVVDSADTIDDNGVYDKEGVSVPSFHVTLPKLGFDLRQAAKDANNSGEFKLSMKDGFCGGREFTAKVESVDASTGKITLRVQRSYDDSLFLWFPYSYAKSVQAVGPGMTNAYQILSGDHFVLTGINVSDVNYVWTASVRLLRKAIHWLCKNDYTRYVYTPKIDEIFMARQDLEAKSDTSGKTVSIHDTLKEGDVLLFDDDDLLINGSVYIDQLTIKENGNNGIPTYDVTLRNEVNVGTLQRIQNKVDSVANDIRTGNIGGNVGMTPTQVDPLVKAYGAKYFLSKTQDDTAQGMITFAKGLISEMLAQLKGGATFGNNGYQFDKDGNVVVDTLHSLAFDEALEQGFGFTKNARGKYTLSVTDLLVWGKAVFNSLEIRKLYSVGGNVYLSGASSKLQHVVPVTDADGEVTGWKCYILGDDGTTATQNGWARYDQAKCQTFDIKEGVYENVSNTYYWRLVTDVSTENEAITETYTDADGKEQTRDLYDGKKFGWVILSKTDCESAANDAPKAGDTIVLDGHRMFAEGDSEGRDQYNDESRTNVMMLETTGVSDGSLPRIVALTGITDYRHSDGKNEYSNTVFILSPKEVVFVSSSVKWISASGDPITFVNFRGSWAMGTEYAYYDQVSHNNAIWTCIVEKGTTTTDEPSDKSTAWRKEISGGKGEKGDPAVTYELEATPSYIKLDADGSFDRSNQYREGKMLLVRGYKIVGGKRITQWGDADNPISIQISFNDGAAWYESTFNKGESGLDEVYNDFEPTCEDSYFSMLQEMKKNGLKNCKAVMYEGESLDPDKIPSDKVLARIDIPIVQDGKDGASGTSYGVMLTVEKRTISSVEDDCLVVTFTKGDTDGVTTTNNVQDIGGYAQLYVDGKIDTSATARLNLGTSEAGELQKGAFPQVFTAGYVTVKWYDKEGGTLLGTGSLTRGADGKDATVYGVQVTPYLDPLSSGKTDPGIQIQFTRTTGATVETFTNVTKLGGLVMVYVDGVYHADATRWINIGNDKIVFSHFPIDNTSTDKTLGTASTIGIELLVNSTVVATANYANGKQGADGIGALEISVAPDTLVFDTNDNGIVPSGTSKTATIACYRDGNKVTNVEYSLMEGGHPDCDASISTSNSTATVTISNIATDKPYGVSKTCGTVEVQVYDIDNGRYYFPTVKFAVNVAKFNGGLKADNKSLESKYKELTNDGSITDLKEYRSEILQSAREISLHVSEKRAGRRNLLPGSAFRKQGEGCSIVQDGQDAINGICINGGYDGVNCARLRNEGDAGAAYPRISWDGGRNSNVKVAKGKKYTLSFWAKRLSATEGGYEISTQFFLQDGANVYSRPYGALKFGSFTVKSQGEWEFIQDTVTIPSEAKANYVEVCICLALTRSGMAEILVCRPMLEEGEEYNGWTLSEQDYDYVGGNLLDGTATLAKTGNVEVLNPNNVTQGGMGESASILASLWSSPTAQSVDFLQYSTSGMGLKANEDYVLSFYAKTEGNAGKLQCYLYPSEGYTNTEDSEGGYDYYNPSDGRLQSTIVPGTRWKRYWVHWRPTKADPKHVLFRLVRGGNDRGTYSSYTTYAVDDVVLYDGTYYRCIMAGQGNTPSSSPSYWDATYYEISLSQPKLEVGATMTEWTAKRSDMVDKQALYATGINIDSKEIILTASNTKFRDNDGKEMAVIDHDGLRATKIATTDNGGGHTEISGNTTVWYNKDGVTPGIKVFYDAAGVPHFQFCNSEGKVMYDFGPSGLQSFISSTQQAYSDVAYLRSVSGGFKWVYVPKNVDADKRFVWRKQIPTTEASSHYEIYDGCVFTKEYYNTVNSVNWPKPAFLLPDGWYVEPNDGNLPIKKRPADEEGVLDPTKTVYYQTFCYYSGGKVSRTVRAYMTRNSNTSDPYNRFSYNGSYDEML